MSWRLKVHTVSRLPVQVLYKADAIIAWTLGGVSGTLGFIVLTYSTVLDTTARGWNMEYVKIKGYLYGTLPNKSFQSPVKPHQTITPV